MSHRDYGLPVATVYHASAGLQRVDRAAVPDVVEMVAQECRHGAARLFGRPTAVDRQVGAGNVCCSIAAEVDGE
jgi:hypothetical protein